MTSIHEGYGDLLDSDDTEIRHCLIGALDHIYTGAVLPRPQVIQYWRLSATPARV